MSTKGLRTMLKAAVPLRVRRALRQTQKSPVCSFRRSRIRWPMGKGRSIKFIIGVAMTLQGGWYATNAQWLDITREAHWNVVFQGESLLSHELTEDVFEHLTPDETRRALTLIARHMREHEASITPVLKEGYRRDGTLVQQPLDQDSGVVMRSRSNAKTMSGRAGWDFVDANTSLVVDGTLRV